VPNKLYEAMDAGDDVDLQLFVYTHAHSFFECLKRMDAEERDVIIDVFYQGCSGELPENVHINVDFLRRLTGKPVTRLTRVLGGLRSLGFNSSIREADEDDDDHRLLGEEYLFVVSWDDLRDTPDFFPTAVAYEAIHMATDGFCEEHGKVFLERLDFSQLSSATDRIEKHSPSQEPSSGD
jgi:hypothetical protein